MKKDTVNTSCFAPLYLVKGQENLYKSLLVIVISILTLLGCTTSNQSYSLAPQPPETPISSIEDAVFTPYYFADVPFVDSLSVGVNAEVQSSGFEERLEPVTGAPRETEIALAEDKCRIQDRFDRKALLAYEWGYQRVGLDVDGIGFDGGGESGIKIEYKMNLQRRKTKIQNCRYSSKWQGLIGSGYNEMFVSEDGLVWKDLRNMRKDVLERMDRAF